MKDVLNYKGFIGSVHFSAEDKVFFGKIEGVNDLITFEGRSVDELENAFQFIVDEHIKDCATENPLALRRLSINARQLFVVSLTTNSEK